MTSATLYREGPDLDALLADLDSQYPGRVQVVEVLHPREGGVLGFFARQRVGVHYRLIEPAGTAAPAAGTQAATTRPRPAESAASAASAASAPPAAPAGAAMVSAVTANPAPGAADEQDGTGAEFARLLAELALRTATERRAADQAAAARTVTMRPTTATPGRPFSTATPPFGNRPVEAPTRDSVTAAAVGSARHTGQLALRRQLIEIGVPIDLVPTDAPHAYAAVEELTGQLPEPPSPPAGSGGILVVAGAARQARVAAEAIVAGASIDPERVWAYGHSSDLVPTRRTIASPAQARAVAGRLRESGDGPSVVVVTTDDQPVWAAEPAEVIAAAQPDALWAVVDATCKPADTRLFLARLGTPTALVVAGADRTASPATVWDLGIPIAMLDDRPSSRAAWAVLLLEALARLERTCSDGRR